MSYDLLPHGCAAVLSWQMYVTGAG
jgi:hypothetical protein